MMPQPNSPIDHALPHGSGLQAQPAQHTFWHTTLSKAKLDYPHRIVIDMGASLPLGGIRYRPRGGNASDPGRIKDYRIYVGDTPFGLTPAP